MVSREDKTSDRAEPAVAGERVIVGVNRFVEEAPWRVEIHRHLEQVTEEQTAALRTLLHGDFDPWIESQIEQRHDLARDRGMLAQRRPHIALRIRHQDLPQKA